MTLKLIPSPPPSPPPKPKGWIVGEEVFRLNDAKTMWIRCVVTHVREHDGLIGLRYVFNGNTRTCTPPGNLRRRDTIDDRPIK